MTDSFLENQNISNNIISNKQKNKLHDKKPSLNKDELENYSSCDEDKNETIDNRINDESLFTNVNEEITKKENPNNVETSNKKSKIFSNFNKQKKNVSSRNNNQNLVDSNETNILNTQKTLNKPISPKILSLQRETNIVLSDDVKTGDKRAISGDKVNSKQMQSRLGSSSESKYNYAHRLANSNDKVLKRNFLDNKGIISHNFINNNNIEVAKVTKLNQESNVKTNINNKIFYNNKYYNYKTFNKSNGNKNTKLDLSPKSKNSLSGIKKNIKKSPNKKENKSINNINAVNYNNIQSEDKKKTVKKDDNLDEKIQKIHYSKDSEIISIEHENGLNSDLYMVNKIIDLNVMSNKLPLDRKSSKSKEKVKNLNCDSQERFTISPKKTHNISTNKDINNNGRLTVSYSLPSKIESKELMQPQTKNIEIQNTQINYNQNLQQIKNPSNNPRGAIANIPPIQNNIIYMNDLERNPNLRGGIKNINRNSVSPKGININSKINDSMNNMNIITNQNNIKTINNVNGINEELSMKNIIIMDRINENNISNESVVNYSNNISKLNTVNKASNLNNMNDINLINNLYNINNYNNIESAYDLNNVNNIINMSNENNMDDIYNINSINNMINIGNINNLNIMDNINKKINENNINVNNRNFQNQNSISISKPIQNNQINNLSNLQFINYKNPEISNQLLNSIPIKKEINRNQNSPKNVQYKQTLNNLQINPLLNQHQNSPTKFQQSKALNNPQINPILNQIKSSPTKFQQNQFNNPQINPLLNPHQNSPTKFQQSQVLNNPQINSLLNQNQHQHQNSPSKFLQNQVLNPIQINSFLNQNQQLNNYRSQNNQIFYSQQNKNENQLQNYLIQNEIIPKSQVINHNQISNPILNNIFNNIVPENNNLTKDMSVNYNSFNKSGWLKKYSVLTLPGKDTSGNHKTNQDSFVFKAGINQIKDFNIFGVLDGHGPDGHFVSKFASETIPAKLINHHEIQYLKDPEEIYRKLKENNCRIITQAFVETDNQLKTVNFDAYESGCTCVLIIHIGNHIICANVGDSRAIVVYDQQGDNNLNNYNGVPLSKDFKPELPEEAKRILMSGGEVRQMENSSGEKGGPFRVWARGEGYPGLAMSRSIGDLKGKQIGVIPDPGVLEYNLCDKTKYIVACSDGVWEFLNNEEVKEIGKQYYVQNNPSGFCHDLIARALNLWETNDIVVDDITAVVAFF